MMNEVVNVAILVIATMVLVCLICLICLLAVVTISDRVVSLRILIRKQVAHAQDRAELVERERMARRRAVIHDERL